MSTSLGRRRFYVHVVGIRILLRRRNSLRCDYHPSSLLMRGRLLETVLKAEQGAVPAAVARNHALGRPRDSARRALRPAREELAGLDWRVAGQVRAAGSINPQVERREAGASIARRALCLAGTAPDIAPPGAPLPLVVLNVGAPCKARARRRCEINSCCLQIHDDCRAAFLTISNADMTLVLS